MTQSSFYADGETYGTATVTSNDVTPSNTPSQAPSGFYPGGTVYSSLQDADTVAADAAAAHADRLAADASAAAAAASAVLAGTLFLQKANNLSDLTNVAAAKTSLSLVKADVGLGNVDNTSDVNKPVSTAQASADALVASNAAAATALKANIASPALTGTPTTPTAAALNNTTQIASTAYADAAVGVEKTRALAAEALLAPLASPALTGTPTAPTATVGTNTTQVATTAFVLANGAAAGVSSLNGKTGAVTLGVVPQGRLTLQTGTPVMTSTQSAKTTVFYTPYNGPMVPIYDGTNMVPTVFSELSQLTTDATKSPAAVAASSLYDMFVWNDAGTIRCTRGPAWTNDTTRSAGTALVRVNGILLNNVSITNGPAASRGTYVGTVGSNASSSIDWILPGSAAGGTAGVLNVWNAYNRVAFKGSVVDSTASWAYTTTTYRASDGSNNNRVTFISGLDENFISARMAVAITSSGAAGGNAAIGIDSTSVQSGKIGLNGGASGTTGDVSASFYGDVGLGRHFIQAQERGATGTTFNGGTLFTLDVEIPGM